MPTIPEAPYSTAFMIHLQLQVLLTTLALDAQEGLQGSFRAATGRRAPDQARSIPSAISNSFVTVFQFLPVPEIPSAFSNRAMGSCDFPTPFR